MGFGFRVQGLGFVGFRVSRVLGLGHETQVGACLAYRRFPYIFSQEALFFLIFGRFGGLRKKRGTLSGGFEPQRSHSLGFGV